MVGARSIAAARSDDASMDTVHGPRIPALRNVLVTVSSIGMQFPITSALMAEVEFDAGADGYGLLSSALAAGSVTGAVFAVRIARRGMRVAFVAAASYAVLAIVASLAPSFWSYAAVLVPLGASIVMFTTVTNVVVQMRVPPSRRAHALAIYHTIFLGTVPPGSLFAGWAGEHLGARWAIAIGGLATIAVGAALLLRKKRPESPESSSP